MNNEVKQEIFRRYRLPEPDEYGRVTLAMGGRYRLIMSKKSKFFWIKPIGSDEELHEFRNFKEARSAIRDMEGTRVSVIPPKGERISDIGVIVCYHCGAHHQYIDCMFKNIKDKPTITTQECKSLLMSIRFKKRYGSDIIANRQFRLFIIDKFSRFMDNDDIIKLRAELVSRGFIELIARWMSRGGLYYKYSKVRRFTKRYCQSLRESI